MNRIIKTINRTAHRLENRINRTVKTIIKGRSGFPPQVRSFLEEHGDELITGCTIIRSPVVKPIKKILDVFGRHSGRFNNNYVQGL